MHVDGWTMIGFAVGAACALVLVVWKKRRA
jgi:hypothetical protein